MLSFFLFLLVIGSALVKSIVNIIHINELKTSLSFLEKEILMIRINPNIKKYNDTIIKYEITNQFNKMVATVDDAINSTELIDKNLIYNLEMCFPDNTIVTSLSLNIYELTIQGNIPTMSDISTFEHNLRNNPYFEQIHVSIISRNESGNTFSATCVIKDVNLNETK